MDSAYVWDSQPPNEVEIYSRFPSSTTTFVILNTSLQDVDQWFGPFIRYFPWSQSRPKYEKHTHSYLNKQGESRVVEYVYGELEFETFYHDEQLLLTLLFEYSQRHPECYIHVWNSQEFETVFVYAADLAEQYEGVASCNRPWIHNGSVIILNAHDQDSFLPMERALAQIKNQDYAIHPKITEEFKSGLASKYCLDSVFDVRVEIPSVMAKNIGQQPWLAGQSVTNWRPSLVNKQVSTIETSIVMSLASYAHLVLINDGSTDPKSLGRILSAGYEQLQPEQPEQSHNEESINTREILQNILLSQGRISAAVPENIDRFRELISASEPDPNEEKKQSEEDAEILKKHFETFLEEENRKMELDDDPELGSEPESEPESEILNDDDLQDFIDFCYEKLDLSKYNDDSDYTSDVDDVQAEIGDLQDQIIDVDNEEDVIVYDDEKEEKAMLEKYEQVLDED